MTPEIVVQELTRRFAGLATSTSERSSRAGVANTGDDGGPLNATHDDALA